MQTLKRKPSTRSYERVQRAFFPGLQQRVLEGVLGFFLGCPRGSQRGEGRQRPHPIDDSFIFPDIVPPSCKVLPKPKTLDGCWGGFGCKKMLIRDEYKEAMDFILATLAEERTSNACIITGQPGIGSFFSTRPFWDLRVFLQGNPSSCFSSS